MENDFKVRLSTGEILLRHLGNSELLDILYALKSAPDQLGSLSIAGDTLAFSTDEESQQLDSGFRFVDVVGDLGLLADGAKQSLTNVNIGIAA